MRALLLLLALAAPALAAAPTASVRAVADQATLSDLTTRRPGTWNRASVESVKLAPGKSLTLFETDKPGQINRFWFTMIEGRPNQPDFYNLRTLRIEIYWDGDKEPAVRVPAGDFFGVGHGIPATFTSGVTSSSWRAMTAYWPMPFAKGAKVVAVNDGDVDALLFSQIDWLELPADQVAPMRLQASWRRNERPKPGAYVVADVTGRGQFVGTVLAVAPTERSWWGEGNDIYLVDGRRIVGTGTEDFVNQGWGVQPVAQTWAGTLKQTARHLTLYRWMVPDAIPFDKSFHLTFEQEGYYKATRTDDIAATAVWYQERPLTKVPELPAGNTRVPPPGVTNQSWTVKGAATPLDLHAAAKAAGRATTDTVPIIRFEPNLLKAGTSKVAGVDLPIKACSSGRACGVALRPTERVALDVPPNTPALWLLLAAEGVPAPEGQPPSAALEVVAGDKTLPLYFGRELDGYLDPWPVPNGRMVQAADSGINMQAAFVVPVKLPPGVTKVELVAPKGSKGAAVYAASAGPLPTEPLTDAPPQGLPQGE